jgi:D-alanyl-D-alanine carboxypeptidase (penicillin-binding protein 5/6)
MKKFSTKQKLIYSIIAFFSLIIVSFSTLTIVRGINFSKIQSANILSNQQQNDFELLLQNEYSHKNTILTKLPYNLAPVELDVGAESAILINTSNGNILYEKNADKIIPPASMTKLFAMHVVMEEVRLGNLSYDDIIDLPPETWACNMPPHSSLMFLGKGHIVTLEELLLGMAISSGNDAAYAVAYKICGSMQEFVARMNEVAQQYGLKNTHFVDSSGYSELNSTTAREMATFAQIYLQLHPEALEKFHKVPSFTYPKPHNMAPQDEYGAQDWSQGLPETITMGITQKNTNPLLDKLPGCDGLKTGFINESGYNLSLTVQRDNTRFLSITMGGKGNNTHEGNLGRIHDGTQMMEWAFSSFSDFYSPEFSKLHFIKSFGTKEKGINLVPAFRVESISVPYITNGTLQENLLKVQVHIEKPSFIFGEVEQGQIVGNIIVSLDGIQLEKIPLVCDRTTLKSNFIVRVADYILGKIFY